MLLSELKNTQSGRDVGEPERGARLPFISVAVAALQIHVAKLTFATLSVDFIHEDGNTTASESFRFLFADVHQALPHGDFSASGTTEFQLQIHSLGWPPFRLRTCVSSPTELRAKSHRSCEARILPIAAAFFGLQLVRSARRNSGVARAEPWLDSVIGTAVWSDAPFLQAGQLILSLNVTQVVDLRNLAKHRIKPRVAK